jgi:hypothetical protein
LDIRISHQPGYAEIGQCDEDHDDQEPQAKKAIEYITDKKQPKILHPQAFIKYKVEQEKNEEKFYKNQRIELHDKSIINDLIYRWIILWKP